MCVIFSNEQEVRGRQRGQELVSLTWQHAPTCSCHSLRVCNRVFTAPLTQWVYYECVGSHVRATPCLHTLPVCSTICVDRKIGDGTKDLSCIARTEGHFVHKALSAALCVAKRIESAESSMPATCVKCGASVSAKRPVPVCVYEVCRGRGA
jgi:hypothetical protein